MGTVIDYSVCECGGLRVIEWNYRTREESDICLKCGKATEAFRYTDETGEYVLEDAIAMGGKTVKCLALKVEKNGGYGTARLAFKDAAETLYSFNSKEEVLRFKDEIELKQKTKEIQLDLNRTYIFSYDPETKIGEILYGESKPEEGVDVLSSEEEVSESQEEVLCQEEPANREELEIVKTIDNADIVKLYATEAGCKSDIFNSRADLLATYPNAEVVEGYSVFDPEKGVFPLGKACFFQTVEEAEGAGWALIL